MSRWIDADAIKEKSWQAESEACFYALEDVVSVTDIDEAPSIDIVPKRGEWIEQEDCWQCSECGDEFVLEVGVKPIDAKMNFCPNCGADMRERKESE